MNFNLRARASVAITDSFIMGDNPADNTDLVGEQIAKEMKKKFFLIFCFLC